MKQFYPKLHDLILKKYIDEVMKKISGRKVIEQNVVLKDAGKYNNTYLTEILMKKYFPPTE